MYLLLPPSLSHIFSSMRIQPAKFLHRRPPPACYHYQPPFLASVCVCLSSDDTSVLVKIPAYNLPPYYLYFFFPDCHQHMSIIHCILCIPSPPYIFVLNIQHVYTHHQNIRHPPRLCLPFTTVYFVPVISSLMIACKFRSSRAEIPSPVSAIPTHFPYSTEHKTVSVAVFRHNTCIPILPGQV